MILMKYMITKLKIKTETKIMTKTKENRMTNTLIMNKMEDFGSFIDTSLSFLTSTSIFMKKKKRKMKINSLYSISISSHFKTMSIQTKNTTN